MSPAEQERRRNNIRRQMEQERNNPPQWYFVSFADDTHFIGGLVTYQPGPMTATMRAHQLKIYPGGSSRVSRLLPPPEFEIPANLVDRILTEEEVDRHFGTLLRKG